MSIVIDSREQISHQLARAAHLIGHYGLATDALITPHPGHSHAILITGTDQIAVSPLGALVLANNPGPGHGEYELPHGWDTEPDGLWSQLHLAVAALAQYLVTTGQAVWGTDPGATISDWARQARPTKDVAVETLQAAAKAVLTAGPLDPMWTGDR